MMQRYAFLRDFVDGESCSFLLAKLVSVNSLLSVGKGCGIKMDHVKKQKNGENFLHILCAGATRKE
jgi:hypothetical protein